jgi:hypothetical protein
MEGLIGSSGLVASWLGKNCGKSKKNDSQAIFIPIVTCDPIT